MPIHVGLHYLSSFSISVIAVYFILPHLPAPPLDMWWGHMMMPLSNQMSVCFSVLSREFHMTLE